MVEVRKPLMSIGDGAGVSPGASVRPGSSVGSGVSAVGPCVATDDGVGAADPAAGTGLRGIADRVEALSGRLHVSSPPGEGTRIRAEIPTRPGAGATAA